MTTKKVSPNQAASQSTSHKGMVHRSLVNESFFLAHIICSAPSAQILIAVYLAHRYNDILPLRHSIFCLLYPAYLLLANHFRFANNMLIRERPESHPHHVSVVISEFFSGENEPWFKRYMILASIIGLALPLVTISLAPGDVAALAAPHLFVLWCQIISESVVMFNAKVHRFITLLLPLGFCVYRMNILADWFQGSLSMYMSASSDVPAWHAMGLALAGLNLVFWTYNLMVTLLLRIVPEFLSKETCEYPEVMVVSLPFIREPVAKMAELK